MAVPRDQYGMAAGGGGVFVPLQPVFVIYMALLAGSLVLALRRWRTADLIPIAVMGLWLALSLWHLRAVSDMVLLTSPFVAAALSRAWSPARRGPVLVASGLLLGVTGVALWSASGIWTDPRQGGWRWTRGEPVCAVAAVARLGLSGHTFTEGENSWLLYRFSSAVQVDMTWEYVAGPARRAEVRRVGWDPAVIPRLVAHERIDFISLRHSAFARQVYQALLALGWTFVHLDDRYFVMVPRRPDTVALIEREGYRHILPWTNEVVTTGNARRVLEEAERALRHCPEGATFAWAYKSSALYTLGRPQEAFEARLKVPEKLVIE